MARTLLHQRKRGMVAGWSKDVRTADVGLGACSVVCSL